MLSSYGVLSELKLSGTSRSKSNLFGSVSRHLVTLPTGFRIARGSEKAVVAALVTPTKKPRVFFIPQWCVDPVDPRNAGEFSSLDLDDLKRMTAADTGGLCLDHGATSHSIFLGAGITPAAVQETLEGRGEPGGLRGAAAARQSSDQAERVTHAGLALLKSDAVTPVIVVDLWSAPALFLRHIEVCFWWGWEQPSR